MIDTQNDSSANGLVTVNKKIGGRGRNKCKKVAKLQGANKVKVEFYQKRIVGKNQNEFSRRLGFIVRNGNICPVRIKSFKEISPIDQDHMWAVVQKKSEQNCRNRAKLEDGLLHRTGSKPFRAIIWELAMKSKDLRSSQPSRAELMTKLQQQRDEDATTFTNRIEEMEVNQQKYINELHVDHQRAMDELKDDHRREMYTIHAEMRMLKQLVLQGHGYSMPDPIDS
ncbi:hypothetical protein Dimus_033506 [Dionaea muscipula]